MKHLLFACTLLLSTFCQAQIIPQTRMANWSASGYKGIGDSAAPILDVTTFGGVGDGITDNTTAIQSTITAASGNRSVIYFPPGNYLIGSTLNLPDSIILKGSGADSTHLHFNLNGAVGNCINIIGSGSGVPANVTDGLSRGSEYIIVDNISLFSSDDYINMQQDNGSWDTQPVSWATGSVGQINRITIISGDTLFLEQPLRINYDLSLNPQVLRIIPAQEVGIECLQISRDDSVHTGLCLNMYYYYAANCWMRGVESSKSIGSHIEMDLSTNISITGCYVHHNYEYDGTSTHGYGITLFAHTGQCRIENNIMNHLRHSFSLQTGANGNVIAYNYSRDPNRSEVPSNYGADISLHGHFPFANLFEGNVIQNIGIDQTWGPSGPFNTFLRNNVELYGIVMTSGTAESDSLNFIGNEIPNTGFLLGNFIISGNDQFSYGNIVRGTLTPSGTGSLTDSSYYLTSRPSFWSNSTWPSIGVNSAQTGSNPAKDRYVAANGLTVCEEEIINTISSTTLSNTIIYPNPVQNQFTISTSEKITLISVYTFTGEKCFEQKLNTTKATLVVPDQLKCGIYFVKIRMESEKMLMEKIVVSR